jgi:hypothetical protein
MLPRQLLEHIHYTGRGAQQTFLSWAENPDFLRVWRRLVQSNRDGWTLFDSIREAIVESRVPQHQRDDELKAVVDRAEIAAVAMATLKRYFLEQDGYHSLFASPAFWDGNIRLADNYGRQWICDAETTLLKNLHNFENLLEDKLVHARNKLARRPRTRKSHARTYERAIFRQVLSDEITLWKGKPHDAEVAVICSLMFPRWTSVSADSVRIARRRRKIPQPIWRIIQRENR